MDNTIIDIMNPPRLICIGRKGENVFREVPVDVSGFVADHPNGTITAMYQSGENEPFPVVLEQNENVYTWRPRSEEITDESGRLEIILTEGNVIGASKIIECNVDESLIDGSAHPAETAPAWSVEMVQDVTAQADRAEAAVEHYPQIRNGYWYVWDVESSAWVNTGVKASGEGGSDSIVYVTIDGSDKASMSASEILAAVDDGKFPILELFGIYIPYSAADDLEFKPVFAKTALSTNGDGTQTAQTAQITVNEDKTWSWETVESPTKTSELTNDSGFITAQEAAAAAPVQSVNGMTGAVTIPTGDPNAVLYTPQTPAPVQQEQARENIGAAASAVLLSALIPILREGIYGSDQTTAITALEIALGGTPEPVDPIETYTPAMSEGYTNPSNGATGGTATYRHTEILPVRPGDRVYGSCWDSTYSTTRSFLRVRFTAAYDANSAIYPDGGSSTQADYSEASPFVVPEGVYGVVFSIVNSLANDVVVYVDKTERVGA